MTRHKHSNNSYMGPLLVLTRLALRHRNTARERMNTSRDTAPAEVVNQRRPFVVSYQAASSVGQTWRERRLTQNPKSAQQNASRQGVYGQPYACLEKKKKFFGVQTSHSSQCSNDLQEVCVYEFKTNKKRAGGLWLSFHVHVFLIYSSCWKRRWVL